MTNAEQTDRENLTSFDTAADETLAPTIPSGSQLDAYTPLQRHTLARFTRLNMLRRDLQPRLDATDWRMRLLNKALYSTYRDCLEQDLENEAELLRSR